METHTTGYIPVGIFILKSVCQTEIPVSEKKNQHCLLRVSSQLPLYHITNNNGETPPSHPHPKKIFPRAENPNNKKTESKTFFNREIKHKTTK